jgi:RNA polymerase-binding transcription factor DksA
VRAWDAASGSEENVPSRETLERELEEIDAQTDRLQMTLEQKPDYGLGKGDPLITRWELNQALLERLRKRARRVQVALGKLDEGTYGVCERCGKPIHPDRMAALPKTRLCISCARESPDRGSAGSGA